MRSISFLAALVVSFSVSAQSTPIESGNNITSSRTLTVLLTPLDNGIPRADLAKNVISFIGQPLVSTTFPASPTAYTLTGYRVTINIQNALGIVPGAPMVFDIPKPAFKVPAGLTLTETYFSPPLTDGTMTSSLGPDTIPPSAPGALVGSASTSAVGLTWGVATDNVGVVSYAIERCAGCVGFTGFTQVAVLGATVFSDVGLTPGQAYSYRVNATDAAGNIGAYSNIVTVTVPLPAPPPPPAPTQSVDCTRMPPATQLLVGKDVWTQGVGDPDAVTVNGVRQISVFHNGAKVKGSVTFVQIIKGVIYNFDPTPPAGSGQGVERWNGTGWTLIGTALPAGC